jgi:hypothetical protein
MADIVHLSVHCLWAAVAAYALTVCRAWLAAWLERDALPRKALQDGLNETSKTVLWLKNELEKLRAVPRTPRL